MGFVTFSEETDHVVFAAAIARPMAVAL